LQFDRRVTIVLTLRSAKHPEPNLPRMRKARAVLQVDIGKITYCPISVGEPSIRKFDESSSIPTL